MRATDALRWMLGLAALGLWVPSAQAQVALRYAVRDDGSGTYLYTFNLTQTGPASEQVTWLIFGDTTTDVSVGPTDGRTLRDVVLVGPPPGPWTEAHDVRWRPQRPDLGPRAHALEAGRARRWTDLAGSRLEPRPVRRSVLLEQPGQQPGDQLPEHSMHWVRGRDARARRQRGSAMMETGSTPTRV